MYASAEGHATTVEFLIQSGADVNEKDLSGITALMLAVTSHQTETIKLLTQAGADVNAKNINGKTALDKG